MGSEWNTRRAFEKTVRSHLYRGAIAVMLFDDARDRNIDEYDQLSEKLEARAFDELMDNEMVFEEICTPRTSPTSDENACALCGRHNGHLTKDHLWPKSKGGKGGKNFIWVCPSCNSKKKNMDLFEWLESEPGIANPVPIDVVRRYLLNAWNYCRSHDILDKQVKNVGKLPFKLRAIPSRLRLG